MHWFNFFEWPKRDLGMFFIHGLVMVLVIAVFPFIIEEDAWHKAVISFGVMGALTFFMDSEIHVKPFRQQVWWGLIMAGQVVGACWVISLGPEEGSLSSSGHGLLLAPIMYLMMFAFDGLSKLLHGGHFRVLIPRREFPEGASTKSKIWDGTFNVLALPIMLFIMFGIMALTGQ